MPTANINPIEDLECPKCNNNSGFFIGITSFTFVDHTGAYLSEVNTFEIDNYAVCQCAKCRHIALVWAFKKIFIDDDEDYSEFDEKDFK